MNVKYSVIIPTFNEEILIEKILASLVKIDNIEIIISDGGSSDKTVDIVKKYNVKIVNSKTGRGIQLNEGAKISNGEILCFLHADTLLPENAFDLIDVFFLNSKNKICRFKLGFDIDYWMLDFYKYFSGFDTVFTRFGDSFIAVRKGFYNVIGGFPNWEILEDVDFLRRASHLSKVKILDGEVISSSRNFLCYGIIKQQIFSGKLILKYLLGFRDIVNNSKYYSRKEVENKTSIIVFVKYPTEGQVKTRLAKTVGNRFATKFYKITAENIVLTISRIKNTYKYIFYSDKQEKEKIKKWLNKNYFYCNQEGRDLGERMKNAFMKVFGNNTQKAIIIGSDIPDISESIVLEAINKLDESDIVIGPSPDGGYYLLGMKKFNPFIFENITYSTEKVFEDTLRKIKENNLSFTTLRMLDDIDTEEDLKNWLKSGTNKKLKLEINNIFNSK